MEICIGMEIEKISLECANHLPDTFYFLLLTCAIPQGL